MEICSAEFYVAHTKISGMCNHRVFWNKLNSYQNARGIFFSSVPRKKVLGNKKSSSTVKCLSVCLLIYLGPFWYSVFWAWLWGNSQTFFVQEREGYLFILPVWHFVLATTRDWSLSCLAWLSPPLSHLPTGHKISALSRQVTQHGAICSNVMMYHRLTAHKKLHYYEFMLLQYVQFVLGILSS